MFKQGYCIYCNYAGEVWILHLCLVPGASRNNNHKAFITF